MQPIQILVSRGRNGGEIFKKESRFNSLPIILLTARAEKDDRISAFEAGVNDYITKPFSPRD
jgi:two-component system phosphate regulon response regulator PhoB